MNERSKKKVGGNKSVKRIREWNWKRRNELEKKEKEGNNDERNEKRKK